MKYKITIILFLIASIVVGQSRTRRVLFLGNSYTYVNNLPQLVKDIALNVGDTLIYDSNLIGGYTLDQHLSDTISTNKIKMGCWDYVILQDQSQAPALPNYSGSGAYSLCKLIKKFNPCARPLFYMTWGRKTGDALNCPTWPPICDYNGMDSLLFESYMEMAFVNNAEVSPVGAIWKYIRKNNPTIELYDLDGSHPSLYGSYLAACSFYTSIFKKDPTHVNFNYVLNSNEASIIRNASKLILFDSLPNWYFHKPNPSADFIYSIGSGANQVDLINRSMYADTYLWDFGDGFTSGIINPSHNYASDGSYTITLKSSSCDLSQVKEDSIQINVNFCSFSPSVFPDSLLLCPNSTDTLWTQVSNSYQWLDAYGDPLQNETKQYLVPPSSGFYSVLATTNGCSERSQNVIVESYHSIQSYFVELSGNLVQPATVCIGDSLKLILVPNKPPFPPDENIQWYNGGIAVPFSNNDTITIHISGNYSVTYIDSIYCPGNVVFSGTPFPIDFINCNTGFDDNSINSDVSIFPNPAEEFNVKIDIEMKEVDYTLFDIFGRVVQRGVFENKLNKLALHHLINGIYLLRIQNISGGVFKLVKK